MSTRPIVYVTSGIFGYLYRFIPIGRELTSRGRHLIVVTASGEAAAHASAAGFETRHLRKQESALDALTEPRWSGALGPVVRRIPGVALGPRPEARARWEAHHTILTDTSELLTLLDELEPDLVLTEPEEHRDIRAMLSVGHRIVLLEDLYSVRPGPDVPYPGRNHAVPDGSVASRIRAFVSWNRFLLLHRIKRRAERRWVDGHDWHSSLAAVGEPDADRRYFQFYDYPGVPRIRTIAPELAFPGEPQPAHVVGPIVDTDRVVHDVDRGFADWWGQQTVDGRAHRIIYISLGTFLAGFGDLVATAIEAAAAVKDATVLVSVGKDIDQWNGRVLPDNVAVFGRVPQVEVLEAADLCISTGGLNTGHEALWFGVPVLNLLVGGVDTPGNASRLTYYGVARHLIATDVSAATIQGEIECLLGDDGYRDRAAVLGARLRAWNGIENAADVIETLSR